MRGFKKLPIIEYLNETRPHGSNLLPDEPAKRAQARAIAEVINSGIQPYQNIDAVVRLNKSMGRDKRNEWLNHYLDKGARTLEAMLARSSGRFCVGDSVSIADLCLVPQVEAFVRVKKAIATPFDLGHFPNLKRVNANLEAMPEFKRAHAHNQSDYNPS